MVLWPCSSGDGVTAATHISSSRCQWCAPTERESKGGLQNKVNCGRHVTADPPIEKRKRQKKKRERAGAFKVLRKVLFEQGPSV